LHIASFTGNIGDTANHCGSKWLMQNFLDYEFVITQKEIREFYWKQWFFNSQEFVDEANQYDLIMIGGGNYFELWVDYSQTGTSIDIGLDYLKKIKTPILFYSLGCDLGQGTSLDNIEKFQMFLNYVTNDQKYFVSVRNDGSLSNIYSLYGDKYNKKIIKIPDGGFFIHVDDIKHYEIEENKINILINIAGDMVEKRFQSEQNYSYFLNSFVNLLEDFIKKYQINVIFVPHIFKDIKAIYDILDLTNDKICRTNIKVAPYLSGENGYQYLFSLYKQVDLILATRFHSNVCSFALHKNIIGLINYIQIQNLYSEINSNEYININKNNFDLYLKMKLMDHILNPTKYIEFSKQIYDNVLSEAKEKYFLLNNWLNKLFGG
jgi:polysaccharide pyruvyl transferase WcaK-like protein